MKLLVEFENKTVRGWYLITSPAAGLQMKATKQMIVGHILQGVGSCAWAEVANECAEILQELLRDLNPQAVMPETA